MTSVAITLATKALQMQTGIPNIDQKPQEANWKGRKVVPWRLILFISIAAIGVITFVAAIILGSPSTAVMGGILCLTSALAAFQERRFSVLKDLDLYVRALAEKVKNLSAGITDLQEEIENYQEENKKLETNIQDLQTTVKTFEGVPDDWESVLSESEKRLEKKAEELKNVMGLLEKAEQKLEGYTTIAKQMKQQLQDIASTTTEFSSENTSMEEHLKTLQEHLEELNQHSDNLQDQVSDLDEQNDQTEAIMKHFTSHNQLLLGTFVDLKNLYQEAEKAAKNLEHENEELKENLEKTNRSIETLKTYKEKFETLNSNLAEQLKLFEAKIRKFEKYQEGYKQWKQGVSYENFKAQTE